MCRKGERLGLRMGMTTGSKYHSVRVRFSPENSIRARVGTDCEVGNLSER